MNKFVLEMKQINSSCNGNDSEDELEEGVVAHLE
jgi:hypothetical protein